MPLTRSGPKVSLHGPNGFFRHFAGSPTTVVRVDVDADDRGGTIRLRISGCQGSGDWDRHRRPVTIDIVDAYGRDRRVTVQGTKVITIDTRRSGGWYDIALRTPSDPSFGYQLAGRQESGDRLTSDQVVPDSINGFFDHRPTRS